MKRHKISHRSQHGGALIILVLVLLLAGTTVIFSKLDGSDVRIERDKNTALALAEAKVALIGFVIKTTDITTPSYLPNPDLKLSSVIPEGSESGGLGAVDISLIGKLPWSSLDISPLKDGWNECLWYVVSGRYKKNPNTSVFNWDVQGQIDVIDGNGNVLASNLVALIVSPGA
ncbi:MAG: hypothetical protein CVU27_05390, partial [Betaproteobacteria bacterium HGW-Betaproteobacteria-20]